MHIRKLIGRTSVLLICLLAGGLLQPVYADDSNWYQVEIVIFENNDVSSAALEVWPADPGQPDLTNAVELIPPAASASRRADAEPQPYRLLASKDLQLNGVVRSLTLSSKLQPILHLGWRQQVVDKAKGIPIHIHGGKEYIERVSLVPATRTGESGQTIPGPDTEIAGQGSPADGVQAATTSTTPETSRVVSQIDGTFLVTRARYLHVWADLVDSEQMPQGSVAGGASMGSMLARFRMQQHRRMRSQELHYFDHPMFGMLVLVTPYEPPKPPPPPTPAAAAPTTAPSQAPEGATAPATKN